RVDRIRDALPGGHLVFIEDTRRSRIALTLLGNLSSLRYDQTGASALCVVLEGQATRYLARVSTVSRHRRHHYTVRKRQGTEIERRVEINFVAHNIGLVLHVVPGKPDE